MLQIVLLKQLLGLFDRPRPHRFSPVRDGPLIVPLPLSSPAPVPPPLAAAGMTFLNRKPFFPFPFFFLLETLQHLFKVLTVSHC